MKRVITFGTFDVFHVGHLNLLERAHSYGDYLVVGVSSDELNVKKKGRNPIFPLEQRQKILNSLVYVDSTFVEASLESKLEYILHYQADVLVMGDDWAGAFDELRAHCNVVYLPRTPSVSTTATIERIRQ